MLKLDTILLIDDDDVANYLNQDLLSELQIAYSIPIVNNGREGLDYLRKNILKKNYNFSSLILLDMQMPIMNGYEFLVHFNKLKLQSGHNMDVAILSSEQINNRDRMKDLGVSIYLEKPLTEDKIMGILNDLTKRKPKPFCKEIKGFMESETENKSNLPLSKIKQFAAEIGMLA